MKTLILLSIIQWVSSEVYTSPRIPGQLALTFNGGPSAYTGHLLNLLNKENVKGTFFLDFEQMHTTTPYTAAYSRQAKKDDHIVGIYTNDKLDNMLNDKDFQGFLNYVNKMRSLHNELLTLPTFIHVPFKPLYDIEFVELMEQNNITITSYNLDTMDYKSNTSQEAFNNFKEQLDMIVSPAKGAYILLLHDTKHFAVELTSEIINYAKKLDYEITRLDKCIGTEILNSNNKAKESNSLSSKNSYNQIGIIIGLVLLQTFVIVFI